MCFAGGKTKSSRRRPYMISPDVERISGGRTERAILSRASPIAMSLVVARMGWVARLVEWTRRVWPPETRSER